MARRTLKLPKRRPPPAEVDWWMVGIVAGTALAALLTLTGCSDDFYRERQPGPPAKVAGVAPALERPALAGTVAANVQPPPPVEDRACPVRVPRPEWARAIRAAGRAAFPARQLEASCTLAALAQAESHWDPRAESPVGARGLVQLMPGTARDLGVDPFDPVPALHAGMRYYAWLFGQWRAHDRTDGQRRNLALAGYNWGLGNLLRVQGREGCIYSPCFYPSYPPETRAYVWRIDRLRATGEWLPHPPAQWRPH